MYIDYERIDFVSVWLILSSDRDQLNQKYVYELIEDWFGIITFNEELLGTIFCENGIETPVEEVLSKMTSADQWMPSALHCAKELGVNTCVGAFTILDFAYAPTRIDEETARKSAFLGAFECEYTPPWE